MATADPNWATAPSALYSALDRKACLAELQQRHIAFKALDEAAGVLAPVRLEGPLGGVRYRTALPPQKGKLSPWEVFDCRLVLSLHDLSVVLSRHSIDEALIYSAWRPPRKNWPKDKLARRHPGALAVDIFKLHQRSSEGDEGQGVWLDVTRDFHGKIGATTCGDKAAKPRVASKAATQLRSIVCETAKARLFTSILTPNYNKAHFNHFHFDLATDVKWRIVR